MGATLLNDDREVILELKKVGELISRQQGIRNIRNCLRSLICRLHARSDAMLFALFLLGGFERQKPT
jgi:hypothetical protein